MPVLKSSGDGSSSSSSSSSSVQRDSSEGRIIGYNRSGSGSISLSNYGSVPSALESLTEKKATRSVQKAESSTMTSSPSRGSPKHKKGSGERVSFYGANAAAAAHDEDEDTNTKSHHHRDKYKQPVRHHSPHRPHSHQHPHHPHHHRVPSGAASSSSAPLLAAQTCSSSSFTFDDEEAGDGGGDAASSSKQQQQHSPSDATNITKIQSRLLRRIALQLSLYVNIIILLTKLIAYVRTLSLSVLAALVDSILDVVSQIVLNYTEKHSSMQRSSALYPAGASRLEPVGVLTCAALMGMASFEVLKEAVENLIEHHNHFFDESDGGDSDNDMSSFWSMALIVAVKLGLLLLCKKAAEDRTAATSAASTVSTASSSNNTNVNTSGTAVQMSDPTLDALAQDHLNDALSNAVAAAALLCALSYPSLWFLDPIGAILISLYIIFSWYATGKEQIEQLTGKSAPSEFIDELYEIANNFDTRMVVDVIRAYHFGPKFLVELEVVLPRDTLLFESHDLGMELQYEIEGREEVERCFVHIDYESRPYDEHVVSKVPELRAKYRKSASSCHSV